MFLGWYLKNGWDSFIIIIKYMSDLLGNLNNKKNMITFYGATTIDDNVLPVGAEEMGAGVIIYLLLLNRVRAMLDMPLSLNFNLTIIN